MKTLRCFHGVIPPALYCTGDVISPWLYKFRNYLTVFLSWLGPLGRSLLESNQVTAPVDRALPFRHELTQLSQLAFEGWPENRLTFGVGPAAGDDSNHLGWVLMRNSLQEVAHRPLCLSHGLAVQIQFGLCDLVAELVSQFGIVPPDQPRSAFSHRLTFRTACVQGRVFVDHQHVPESKQHLTD